MSNFSQKKREAVYEKSSGKCCYCGANLTLDKNKCYSMHYMQIDHIIPKSLGGKNNIENLQATCKSCNSSKGARHGRNLTNTIITSIKANDINEHNRKKLLQESIKQGSTRLEELEEIKSMYYQRIKEIEELIEIFA